MPFMRSVSSISSSCASAGSMRRERSSAFTSSMSFIMRRTGASIVRLVSVHIAANMSVNSGSATTLTHIRRTMA